MLAVQEGLFCIRFHLVSSSKHHYHMDHSNFSRNFMIDAELYVPSRQKSTLHLQQNSQTSLLRKTQSSNTLSKYVVRGDNSEIFSKAVLIFQITIVMHISELHPTFSNQTNQQRCHVTKENTWWHWKALEKFCKHSSKCLTIKKKKKNTIYWLLQKIYFPCARIQQKT